jgi:hypothetical protein
VAGFGRFWQVPGRFLAGFWQVLSLNLTPFSPFRREMPAFRNGKLQRFQELRPKTHEIPKKRFPKTRPAPESSCIMQYAGERFNRFLATGPAGRARAAPAPRPCAGAGWRAGRRPDAPRPRRRLWTGAWREEHPASSPRLKARPRRASKGRICFPTRPRFAKAAPPGSPDAAVAQW